MHNNLTRNRDRKSGSISVLIIYVDKIVWQYHLIITSMSIDDEEQMVIIDIKLGIQYFICQVPLKKPENLYQI